MSNLFWAENRPRRKENYSSRHLLYESLCLALLGFAWLSLALLCLALLGFAWLALALLGLALLGFAWLCLALLGFVWATCSKISVKYPDAAKLMFPEV